MAAAVVAEAAGDVGPAVEAEDAEGEAQAGHGAGCGAGADTGGVLAERDVADVVFFVLDPPVPADVAARGVPWSRGGCRGW